MGVGWCGAGDSGGGVVGCVGDDCSSLVLGGEDAFDAAEGQCADGQCSLAGVGDIGCLSLDLRQ